MNRIVFNTGRGYTKEGQHLPGLKVVDLNKAVDAYSGRILAAHGADDSVYGNDMQVQNDARYDAHSILIRIRAHYGDEGVRYAEAHAAQNLANYYTALQAESKARALENYKPTTGPAYVHK